MQSGINAGACNSLHLTEMGFKQALEKIFHANPKMYLLLQSLALQRVGEGREERETEGFYQKREARENLLGGEKC